MDSNTNNNTYSNMDINASDIGKYIGLVVGFFGAFETLERNNPFSDDTEFHLSGFSMGSYFLSGLGGAISGFIIGDTYYGKKLLMPSAIATFVVMGVGMPLYYRYKDITRRKKMLDGCAKLSPSGVHRVAEIVSGGGGRVCDEDDGGGGGDVGDGGGGGGQWKLHNCIQFPDK